MAKGFINERGFKVIECTAQELRNATGQILVRCDWCNDIALSHNYKGYYIAVLNKWYCKKCYTNRMLQMRCYPQDAPIENRNYATYAQILGVEEDLTNN